MKIGKRPRPPAEILEEVQLPLFAPADDLVTWARDTFIAEGSILENPDHRHLNAARIGALWTNVSNGRQGRSVVGQCEIPLCGSMGKWARGRAEMQINEWFGSVPDFILTFDAQYADTCSDAELCALVEHELYHAAQERDQYGAPKFSKASGLPVFAIRGHDVEEFVGIVRRYGADAAHVSAFIEAGKAEPEIGRFRISQACGTCKLRAA